MIWRAWVARASCASGIIDRHFATVRAGCKGIARGIGWSCRRKKDKKRKRESKEGNTTSSDGTRFDSIVAKNPATLFYIHKTQWRACGTTVRRISATYHHKRHSKAQPCRSSAWCNATGISCNSGLVSTQTARRPISHTVLIIDSGKKKRLQDAKANLCRWMCERKAGT